CSTRCAGRPNASHRYGEEGSRGIGYAPCKRRSGTEVAPRALNLKFERPKPQTRLRSSGSKGPSICKVASVLRFRSSHQSVLQGGATFGIGTLANLGVGERFCFGNA